MNFHDYVHHHVMGVIIIGFCAWVSLSLIIQLWVKQRQAPWHKKVAWSLMLGVPFLGWLFYGAFYHPLRENSVKAKLNHDAVTGVHGDSFPDIR